MKKIYPYILPSIALLVIFFLTIKWYSNRTQQDGDLSHIGEGVQIEDLSTQEADVVLNNGENVQRVKLEGGDKHYGEVKYEVKDGKVFFTVSASLPDVDQGGYEVWLKSPIDDSRKKAFVLESGKGGYFGSAAVSKDIIPFELIVSRETNFDNQMEEVVLTGTINQVD